MKKVKVISLLLVLTMVLSLVGCSSKTEETNEPEAAATEAPAAEATKAPEAEAAEPEVDEPSHVNIAMFTWIEGLDPAEGWHGWCTMRCGIGETLVTADENLQVVPCLADSWEQIDDLTYKFHIRQGVKFSNGNDMTPETVKASIERTAEKNSRGGNLKLDSITIDGEDVIFKTTEPYSAFVYYLTEPMCIIVDTTVDDSNFEADPICTGPYVCTEYVVEEKYEMEKNSFYWGGEPDVDFITVLNISNDTKVSAMLANDIDIAVGCSSTTLSQVEGNPDIDMVRVTGTRETDIELNCREGHPTADVNLRKALSFALDREVLSQVSGYGYATPLGNPFPSTVGYGTESVNGQTFDLAKSAEFLALAGYADTDGNGYVEKDGEELVLRICIAGNSGTAVYEAIKDMWKAAGVHAEIEMLESIKDVRTSGDYDVIPAGWQSMNNADGQSYLKNRWSVGGPDNYTEYSSEAYEAVMQKLNGAFDLNDRIACFREAAQIIADDCPALFICANENITLVNNTKVSNVTVFPIDYYQVTGKWTAVK